jgi:hypothetical protein
MENSKIKKVPKGRKEVSDLKDGEIHYVTTLEAKRFDVNFIKIFMPLDGMHMIPSILKPASVHLYSHLCFICNQENIAVSSSKSIMDNTGMSIAGVKRAKAQLLELDYIREVASNNYMINPNMATKTDGGKRENLCERYSRLIKKE